MSIKHKPFISVIIPALNEEKTICQLLDALNSQTYKNFEVIVADADSADKTRQICRQKGAVVVNGGMPGYGRNRGAEKASGDYFIFLDADIVPEKIFLAQAVKSFDKNYFGIATFKHIPISDKKIDHLILNLSNKIVAAAKNFYPYAFGSAIICTKRIFFKINGFDESLYLAEDHDLVKRACKYVKFGFIDNTYVNVSVRRLESEGRINMIKKYLLVELHRAFKGKIKKDIVGYDFAKFENNQNMSAWEEKLEKILKKINKL